PAPVYAGLLALRGRRQLTPAVSKHVTAIARPEPLTRHRGISHQDTVIRHERVLTGDREDAQITLICRRRERRHQAPAGAQIGGYTCVWSLGAGGAPSPTGQPFVFVTVACSAGLTPREWQARHFSGGAPAVGDNGRFR